MSTRPYLCHHHNPRLPLYYTLLLLLPYKGIDAGIGVDPGHLHLSLSPLPHSRVACTPTASEVAAAVEATVIF